MRILYFISYPQRMAGANKSLFELVRSLPKDVGREVVVVGEGVVAEAYRSVGEEVLVLAPRGDVLRSYGKHVLELGLLDLLRVLVMEFVPYCRRVMIEIKRFKPDVVHVNDPRGAILAGSAARILGCPVVGHLRGQVPFSGSKAIVLQRLFEALCDRIVTVSESLRDDLNRSARARSVAIYNGTEDVSGMGKRLPYLEHLRSSGQVTVCAMASIVPFKGLHHLVDAIEDLNQRGAGARAVFFCAGDCPDEYRDYYAWLLNRCNEAEIDNLTFVGWQADPFSFYRTADISVLPSVRHEMLELGDGEIIEIRGNEGFPRCHLEAMCFSLPVVGTRIAGVPEQVIDGETGILVPPSCPTSLADALETLILSSRARERMGKAGKDRVRKQFGMNGYVNGILHVYSELVSAAP